MWVSNGLKYKLFGSVSGYSKVCVECFAYNQADYIIDAIEGMLRQKCNFIYHILIIDDASDDGTSEIIIDYVEKYPDKIIALIADKNIYGSKEAIDVYADIKRTFSREAKYIATCEGDDYWIDDNKLQIQVDYMDNHPNCKMYLHNSYWLNCDTGRIRDANPFITEKEKELMAEEVISIRNGHPATASRMYCSELLDCPDYVKECSVGDYPMMLYAMTQGTIHYSNRIMCVYRYLSKNSTTNMLKTKRYRMYHNLGVLIFLHIFDARTTGEYHELVKDKIDEYANSIAFSVAKDKSVEECWSDTKRYYYLKDANRYIDKLEKLRRKYADRRYISPSLRSFLDKHENIVIMGTGEVGKIVADQMRNNDVEISGFAVTSVKDGNDTFEGKPIWKLSDYPFGMNDVGIIVAIMPKLNDGVIGSLENSKINDYIWPYQFDEYIGDIAIDP